MHKQSLLSLSILINVITILAMEEPQLSKKTNGYNGMSLQEITINCLLNNENIDPCNHMDALLANTELWDDARDQLKEGFSKKHKDCLINTTIYNNPVKKSIIQDPNVAYLLEDTCIKKLDIQSGKILHTLDADNNILIHDCIHTNDIKNNKKFLITAQDDKYIKLWDLNTNACIKIFNNTTPTLALATNSHNNFYSVAVKELRHWNIETGTYSTKNTLTDNTTYTRKSLLKDGIFYVINQLGFSNHGLVAWDMRSNKLAVVLPLISGIMRRISTITHDADCQFTLFSGSPFSNVNQWDIRNSSQPVCTIETGYAINALATCNNKLYVALVPWLCDREILPGIQVFDIQKQELKLIDKLPGKQWIENLEVNNLGVFAAGTEGLDYHPTRSYENVYNTLKNISAQKALEYEKK